MKNIFIYFLIIMLTAYPVSAADVSLDRWVLNVTLHDDGLVEEVIQVEIANPGPSALDGFSFIVPASGVTVLYGFEHTSSFTGQVVEQQKVAQGIKLMVNFNRSVEAGKKWNGRIGFTAANWAMKEGSNYSIEIPVEAPQAKVGGKYVDMSVPANAEIRSQVFFPESIEVTSVVQAPQQKPFRKLFQNNRIVITWFTGNLQIGDAIKISGSFSNVLNNIVEANEKLDSISARIKESKTQGKDVSEAETHIKNANDYLNQAEAFFWRLDSTGAMDSTRNANAELNQAENRLSTSGQAEVTATATATEQNTEKTPGFEVPVLIFILLITFLIKKKK